MMKYIYFFLSFLALILFASCGNNQSKQQDGPELSFADLDNLDTQLFKAKSLSELPYQFETLVSIIVKENRPSSVRSVLKIADESQRGYLFSILSQKQNEELLLQSLLKPGQLNYELKDLLKSLKDNDADNIDAQLALVNVFSKRSDAYQQTWFIEEELNKIFYSDNNRIKEELIKRQHGATLGLLANSSTYLTFSTSELRQLIADKHIVLIQEWAGQNVDNSAWLNEELLRSYDRSSFASYYQIIHKTELAKQLIDKLLSYNLLSLALFAINYDIAGSRDIAWDSALKEIGSYLERDWTGARVSYKDTEITWTPELVDNLRPFGISPHMLLRNEFFARHGYVFQNPNLNAIYQATSWYRPDASLGLINIKLSALENKNVEYIKSLEDKYDYQKIADWLSSKEYLADERSYVFESDYKVPADVLTALSHININPSRLLQGEILARNNQRIEDPILRKVLGLTTWYKAGTTTELNNYENANKDLLTCREWIDILDSQKTSLPPDVRNIPVSGYNMLYVKQLEKDGRQWYFSSHLMWGLNKKDNALLDNVATWPLNNLTEDQIAQVLQDDNPLRILQRYFEIRPYFGHVDTQLYSHLDYQPPEYLKRALLARNIDWLILLKKEIHARHGARFSDPQVGDIFRACSWYNEKYELTLTTESRLPAAEKLTKSELNNFALLEGAWLQRILASNPSKPIVVDLNGNVYYVKIGRVSYGSESENSGGFFTGYGYAEPSQFDSAEISNEIEQIIRNNASEELEEVERYYGGC